MKFYVVVLSVLCSLPFSYSAFSEEPKTWSLSSCDTDANGLPFNCYAKSPSATQWCNDINVSGEFILNYIEEGQGWVTCSFKRTIGGRPYGAYQKGRIWGDADPVECPDGTSYDAASRQCVSKEDPEKECKVGNPIAVLSGKKVQKESDLAVNVSGSKIDLYRYYSSFLINRRMADSGDVIINKKARTWRFRFMDKLESYRHTLSLETTTYTYVLAWHKPNRERVSYRGDTPDAMVASDPTMGSVEPLVPGSHTSGWRLTDRNLDVYEFNSNGDLTSFTDHGGLTINFEHVSSYERKATVNGVHVFTINTLFRGEVTDIVLPSGNKYTYTYDTYQNLVNVIFPDQTQKIYHYDDPNYPMLLSGITNRNGVRYVDWEYNMFGEAISSENYGGMNRYDLDLSNQYSSSDPRVKVTNPYGKETTYHFDRINGARKITKVVGHQSANCAAASRYKTYYSDGSVQTETDWEGNVTLYKYNGTGRVSSVESGYRWATLPSQSILLNPESDLVPPTLASKIERTGYCWDNSSGALLKLIDDITVTTFEYSDGRVSSRKMEPKNANNETCL